MGALSLDRITCEAIRFDTLDQKYILFIEPNHRYGNESKENR